MSTPVSVNEKAVPPQTKSERVPRRLIVLSGDEQSEMEQVLGEFTGLEARGKDIHAEIERQAAKIPGKIIAAEWQSPLGWIRFMTCKKPGK